MPARTVRFTTTLCALWLGSAFAEAPRLYPDDPLWVMPKPLPVTDVKLRKINDVYDVFLNQFGHPGERHPQKGQPVSARGVNSLGEVPDGEWYVNRHYRQRLNLTQMESGPAGDPPSASGKWTVVAAKNEGITPGFTIVDSTGRRFVLKFDPNNYPELATAADVIGSRFFYALGYHVPVNHIVYFDRDTLELGADTSLTDSRGRKRKMTGKDLWDILGAVHKGEDGKYRATASLYLTGKPVGPRRWHGTRRDDPNDTIPHEHRRDLRGMRVFAAWLGHDDSRAINSLDMLVEDSAPHIRHYLIDFGSTLGSASSGPNSPRSGYVPFFSWTQSAQEFFTLGLYVPAWSRARYPDYASVGRFESTRFDPERWVPEYTNPAFENMLPDDAFWAAKQVAAFTDEEIRAAVHAGQISNAEAEQWLVRSLIQRRDRIAKVYLNKVLPLDRFRIESGRFVFDDVGSKWNGPSSYKTHWVRASASQPDQPLDGTVDRVPQADSLKPDEFLTAHIDGGDGRTVRVYLRKRGAEWQVAAVERTWSGRKQGR